jgi:hypothetical protein
MNIPTAGMVLADQLSPVVGMAGMSILLFMAHAAGGHGADLEIVRQAIMEGSSTPGITCPAPEESSRPDLSTTGSDGPHALG